MNDKLYEWITCFVNFQKKSCGHAIDKFEEAVKLKRTKIIHTAMGEEWRGSVRVTRTPFWPISFLSFFCMSYKMYILFLNVTCDEIFVLSLVEVDLITHILPTFIVFILNELNKKTLPCSGTCFQSHVLFFQFFFCLFCQYKNWSKNGKLL